MHSELCPVCKGDGQVEGIRDGETRLFDCHGCNGKGWILVEDIPAIIYVYPQPIYIQPTIPTYPSLPILYCAADETRTNDGSTGK